MSRRARGTVAAAILAVAGLVVVVLVIAVDRGEDRAAPGAVAGDNDRQIPTRVVAKGGLRWTPTAPDAPRRRPRHGRWQAYVLTPAERDVCPERVAVLAGGGSVEDAGSLTCAGRAAGGVARLTRRAGPQQPRIILDFGREMSGPLTLGLESGSPGVRLRIAYSESLAYLAAGCDRLGVEPYGKNLPPCPRTIGVGERGRSYRDRTPRSGFRYVLVSLAPGPAASAALSSATVHYTAQPQSRNLTADAVHRGWFLSSDNALNHYWYDGAYTAQVNTVAAADAGVYYEGIAGLPARDTVIVDGAKRDRYLWFDLAGPKGLIPLLYGDARTAQNTLLALGAKQTARGFLPACRVPASFYGAPCDSAWTDATAWWIIALGEQWRWTANSKLVRSQYPRVVRALRALQGCRDGAGLIDPCNGAATYAAPSKRRRDATTYLNAATYEALVVGAELARTVGRRADARRFDGAAMRLRRRINAVLWDSDAGAYRASQSNRTHHPQDANALTALWGIARGDRARRALAHVRRRLWGRYGVRTGSPGKDFFGTAVSGLVAHWISYFEMRARLDAGQTKAVRAMLDASWGYMHLRWKPIAGPQGNTAEPPSSTGWEHVGADGGIYREAEGSLSHAWSAGATVIATVGFLGLQPATPGFARWTLAPRAPGSGLRWAEGRVPTPHGAFDTAWRTTGSMAHPSSFTLRIDPPAATTGTVAVPLYGRDRRIRRDGRVVWDGGRAVGAVAADRAGDVVRFADVRGSHSFAWGRTAKRP